MTGKKGSERLNNVIVSITIVAAALAIFITVASSADTEHRYLTDFYSHDLALLIEATQAVPGDVSVRYPLSEGFEATLQRDTVTVRHTRSGVRQAQPYHLLEGMTIQEGESEGLVILTKKNNRISLDKRTAAAATSDDCPPLPDKDEEFTIRAQARISRAGAALEKKDLEAMADVLNDQYFERNGLTGNQGTFLTLTLSSEEATSDGALTFKRPDADGDREQVYQHLYCKLRRGLRGTNMELQEERASEKDAYEARLTIALTDDQEETWEEDEFLSSIAESWAHLGTEKEEER